MDSKASELSSIDGDWADEDDHAGPPLGASNVISVEKRRASAAETQTEAPSPDSQQPVPTLPPPANYNQIRQTASRNLYTQTPTGPIQPMPLSMLVGPSVSPVSTPTPTAPHVIAESQSAPPILMQSARVPFQSASGFNPRESLRGRTAVTALIVGLVTIGVSCIIAAAVIVLRGETAEAPPLPPPAPPSTVVVAPAATQPPAEPTEQGTSIADLANAPPPPASVGGANAPVPLPTPGTPSSVKKPPSSVGTAAPPPPPVTTTEAAPSGSVPPGLQFLKRKL